MPGADGIGTTDTWARHTTIRTSCIAYRSVDCCKKLQFSVPMGSHGAMLSDAPAHCAIPGAAMLTGRSCPQGLT
eukprot:2620875-Amphidinium_carterae.1